jgi:hypothetical protein
MMLVVRYCNGQGSHPEVESGPNHVFPRALSWSSRIYIMTHPIQYINKKFTDQQVDYGAFGCVKNMMSSAPSVT